MRASAILTVPDDASHYPNVGQLHTLLEQASTEYKVGFGAYKSFTGRPDYTFMGDDRTLLAKHNYDATEPIPTMEQIQRSFNTNNKTASEFRRFMYTSISVSVAALFCLKLIQSPAWFVGDFYLMILAGMCGFGAHDKVMKHSSLAQEAAATFAAVNRLLCAYNEATQREYLTRFKPMAPLPSSQEVYTLLPTKVVPYKQAKRN